MNYNSFFNYLDADSQSEFDVEDKVIMPIKKPITPLRSPFLPLRSPSTDIIPHRQVCWNRYGRQVKNEINDFNRCMLYANYQKGGQRFQQLGQCNRGLYGALMSDHRQLRQCLKPRPIVY